MEEEEVDAQFAQVHSSWLLRCIAINKHAYVYCFILSTFRFSLKVLACSLLEYCACACVCGGGVFYVEKSAKNKRSKPLFGIT